MTDAKSDCQFIDGNDGRVAATVLEAADVLLAKA